jgi:hypothetical protein
MKHNLKIALFAAIIAVHAPDVLAQVTTSGRSAAETKVASLFGFFARLVQILGAAAKLSPEQAREHMRIADHDTTCRLKICPKNQSLKRAKACNRPPSFVPTFRQFYA